ncbi:hypothetical protein [Phaeobacter inhibens]|uniref:hypothetical protein n=1 Tax=Phaeobacter inhibens TaxID=221822 RepID=UPI0012DC18EA|nr:hypothetical protein [Phaeobacter inhibens]
MRTPEVLFPIACGDNVLAAKSGNYPSGHGDAPLGAFQRAPAAVRRRLRDGFKYYFPTPADFWGDLVGAVCVFVLPIAPPALEPFAMSATDFELIQFPQHRLAGELTKHAANYARCRAALQQAITAHQEARTLGSRDCGTLADAVDSAAEAVGAAQERVADLVAHLNGRGSLDCLADLLKLETSGRPWCPAR